MGNLKSIITVIYTLAAVTLFGQPTTSKNSPVKFTDLVWDFGKIEETKGPVTHIFEFTNTGKKPLIVQMVSVSCGCTTPKFSKEPVKPGGKGSIEITYDPADRPGMFTKEIYIMSSGGISGMMVKIKGDVVPRPRSIEEEYPITMLSDLRLSGRTVNFGQVPQGQTRTATIGYVNNSNRQIELSASVNPSLGHFVASVPQTIAPRAKGEITLKFDLRNTKRYGQMVANTYLTINGEQDKVPLSATALGVDDFTGMSRSKGAKFELSSIYENLGNMKIGAVQTKEFTMTNNGDQTLIVRDVSAQDGLSSTLVAETTIEPDKEFQFKITFDGRNMEKGRAFRTITITTNDPQRPIREVRIVATIVD